MKTIIISETRTYRIPASSEVAGLKAYKSMTNAELEQFFDEVTDHEVLDTWN